MATELDNHCPVCLDSWEEVSYAMPCHHRFCYMCITQWAEGKPECPLCRRTITSILHSVRGDHSFQEHVIPPSAAPEVASAPLGGLPPYVWALLFRQNPAVLWPVLPWLQQQLWLIFRRGRREGAEAVQRLVLFSLQLFGLDEEVLVHALRADLGWHTRGFVRQLIVTIADRCGREARRQMGLEDANAAEERAGSPVAALGPAASRGGSPAPSSAPSSSPGRSEAEELLSASSAALGGGAGSPSSAPVPTHEEREEPQEDPEEAVAGPSAPGRGSGRSPGVPQRAPKRRAGSPEATSPPNKRPPCRQQ
ncbi:E3 ubiquitin-protein ligase rnf146-like [Nyctibius grandis]|uniref:E3 ubiquitin-protein ligase rnf146-like n=1 Tax=Nyctibius grandis TaxID=48427 RepID=UPI0035BBDA50